MLYEQEVHLSFKHALANPADDTMQPATTNSLKKTEKNVTIQSYIINTPEISKTIQNYICKTTNAKTIEIPKNLL